MRKLCLAFVVPAFLIAAAATSQSFMAAVRSVITDEGLIAITDPDAQIAENMPARPAYRARVKSRPFGTRIMRIGGDPGTPIVTPTGVVLGVWTNFSRHHYVTTQPWNADGSLMHIYLGREDVSPNNVILSGSSYKPLYAYYEPRRESRWHPIHPDIRVRISGDTLSWQNVRTGLLVRNWKLPYADNSTGGKWNISLDGRYVGIVGDNRFLYVFDMSTRPGRAGPALDLRADCGLTTCDPPNKFFDLRTSWDGLHFLVHYGPDSNWRLLDANADTLAISHHAFPDSIKPPECDGKVICSLGMPSAGFLPVQLGHLDFLVNTDGKAWIVGQSKYWSNKAIPSVDTTGGRVGRLLAIRLDDGYLKSLTDATNEAWASHIAVRNTARPGWVYASYGRTPAGKYQGEILAVNLNDRRIERYGHHFSDTAGCYDCEVHPSPSADGTKVAFASTWGADQTSALGYVLELLPP